MLWAENTAVAEIKLWAENTAVVKYKAVGRKCNCGKKSMLLAENMYSCGQNKVVGRKEQLWQKI